MATILFGGFGDCSEKETVFELQKEHDVLYTTNSQEVIFQVLRARHELIPKRYDLVVCDSRLFYRGLPVKERIDRLVSELFDCLKRSDAPVVFLADTEIADLIEPEVKKAGFTFVSQPYVIPQPQVIPQPHDVDDVLREISSYL